MAKYLVTGIAGFIGSSIAHELVRRGETVRGLDDFSTGKWENIEDIKKQIDFRRISLLDPAGLATACEGIDYVIHQAALPSVPKSVIDPVLTHAVNVNGTLNMLLAARDAGVKRVVYAASSSAYGESEVLPKREDMLPKPISPYAVQKLTGEYYLQSFAQVYGLETVSLRYFNIFGPRQDANSQYSGVLAKFITQMQRGETPTIFWRWRTEPGLYLCGKCCPGKPESLPCAGKRSVWKGFQRCHRFKVLTETDLCHPGQNHWFCGAAKIC